MPEGEAEPPVRRVYQEVREALGVPLVGSLHQAWGAYPRFLELHWNAVRPALDCGRFFQLGERLRADAYTRMHNYFRIPDLCRTTEAAQLSSGARHELTRVADLFHYLDPLLLLIASAQLQAFAAPVGRGCDQHRAADHPVFAEKPVLVPDEAAEPEVRHTFDELRRAMGVPFLSIECRGFARWPDFLASYWGALKGVLQSPVYSESQQGLRESAWQMARELPHPLELSTDQLLEAGMEDDEVAAVVRITELFVRFLSGQALNVALAKIGLEGGTLQAPRPRAEQAA